MEYQDAQDPDHISLSTLCMPHKLVVAWDRPHLSHLHRLGLLLDLQLPGIVLLDLADCSVYHSALPSGALCVESAFVVMGNSKVAD